MRARGANALFRALFETTYGVAPAGNFLQLPFVSSDLGEEQGLLESDLLGQGRESLDPTLDVINNDGNVVVPVDARAFGHWLMLYLGEPVTIAQDPASGSIKFAGQPAAASTMTINGVSFSFIANGGTPTGSQIEKGTDLSGTLDNIVTALNASADPAVAAATYSKTGTDTLTITHDTAGVAGNSFTLAASATSNGTVSGATLTGGTNLHTFTSGAQDLPSMSIETGMPEVPSFEMNFGARGNTMQISLSRSGLLNATLGLVAQGSTLATSSAAGTPVEVAAARFAQATGQIKKDGVQLAHVVSASMSLSNSLDKVETIRPDSRIEDADPATFMASGNITARFADTTLLDLAGAGTPIELSYGWTKGPHSLVFTMGRVFLPRAKRPISGPNGIQASFDWKGSGEGGNTLVAALVNDVAAYELPV